MLLFQTAGNWSQPLRIISSGVTLIASSAQTALYFKKSLYAVFSNRHDRNMLVRARKSGTVRRLCCVVLQNLRLNTHTDGLVTPRHHSGLPRSKSRSVRHTQRFGALLVGPCCSDTTRHGCGCILFTLSGNNVHTVTWRPRLSIPRGQWERLLNSRWSTHML